MAGVHIESLRAVQPEGPYLIGGFCNGGMMAYEIARQLTKEGQKVELLALIDPADAAPHKQVRKTITRVGKLLGLGPEKHLDLFLWYIYLRIPAYRAKVKKTMHSKEGEQVKPERSQNKRNSALAKLKDLFPPSENLRYQWSGFYRWVAAGYMSGPYSGKAIVFWSSEASSQGEEWAKTSVVKEIEVQVIPGTHKEWKSENLKALADRLKAYLDKLHEDVAQ